MMISFEFLDSGEPEPSFFPMVLMAATVALHRYLYSISKRNASYPPMAPASMYKTIQALSSHDSPFFFWRMGLQLGTSAFRLPLPIFGTPMVAVITNVKLARNILTDPGTIKPQALYAVFDNVTTGVASIITTNGPYWHSRRKGIAPAFSAQHVHRMNSVALAKTDEWIATTLQPLIEKGLPFNVGEEMIDLLLQAISETAFEYTMSMEEVHTFKHELEVVMTEFVLKTGLNPFRSIYGFLLSERHRAKVAAQNLFDHCYKIMDAYRSLKDPLQGTIINLIMTNPCYQTDQERAADILIMLLAGHDTTAYSLAWAMKELAQNPKEQSKLRESILMAKQHDLDPSHLEMVRNVIREAIRLHPVSAAGPARTVGRDFVTPEGLLIPAGSIVILPILSWLRDQSIFGKDWDQFKPQRWDKDHVTNAMNEAFMPFAIGRQNCVGQPLANTELQCILPRIISQFELIIDQPGTTECFLTLKPVNTMLKAKQINAT